MRRSLLLALLVLGIFGLCLLPASAAESVAESSTFVSGGAMPHRVRLTAIDEDAFFRRINLPPRLDRRPLTSGSNYVVTSNYWDKVIRRDRTDRPEVDEDALYYPDGGFIRARQDGQDVWLVIDLKQQAILDRYIRVAADLDETPGPLEVLAAASGSENIGIQIGARILDAGQSRAFWQAASRLTPTDDAPAAGDGVWVVFALPEGRLLQMLYDREAGILSDFTFSAHYRAPAGWLTPVLGADADSVEAASVPQQKGPGSPVWWVIMAGGGVCGIGLAILMRRRFGF